MLSESTSPHSDPPSRTVRHALIWIGVAVAATILVWLATSAVSVLLMAFAGVLVAILLTSLADPIQRWFGLARGWALAIVLLGLLAFGSGLGVLVVPSFAREIDELAKTLPEQTKRIEAQILHYRWGRFLLNQASAGEGNDSTTSPQISFASIASTTQSTTAPTTQEGERLTKTVQAAAEPLVDGAGLLAAGVLNGVLGVIIVIAAGIFMAIDPALYVRGTLLLLPKPRRPLAEQTLAAIHYSLRWWLIGQGITMLVIATLTGAGLWLIGVRLWLTFAILAGIFNFVPNFGPLVSFVPAILFALADPEGGHKVIWISLLYVVAQTFEGYVLTPMVQKKAVETPPALLILFQLLAGVLMGSLGLMLAAPMLAAIVVATKMLYVREVLGDRSVTVASDAIESEPD